jgi:S-disulfanyl-L-cysteine oxidoreductase SoxD
MRKMCKPCFVRNHTSTPLPPVDVKNWSLSIEGDGQEKMKKVVIIALILCVLIILTLNGSCGSSPTSPQPTAMPPLSPTSAGPTFGSMANLGQTVFSNRCAGCHGTNGQGGNAPAVIGSGSGLGVYRNAKALLDYISSAMPLNAPGSLSHQDYLNVLCFLLVQNNAAIPDAQFNENSINNVLLE